MNLLLTSVFGPYGVDDIYGRKENLMEVLHNQVTREQGVFSMRFNQESYGLHLLAANVDVPVTVLDFPSQRRFIKEIKKGYDYIGISFILQNFKKARRMAQLIRRYAPKSKIILGGHGTSLENIEEKIPCDYICRGEGVGFLRKLFGEDVDAPVKHPLRFSAFNRYILGTPVSNKLVPEGIIMPGVGCVSGCRFCSTTHFFQKTYTPYLKTGRDFFNLCREYEEKMGITDFFVLDENFFKSEDRARALLASMEKHKKTYSFNVFSSADTIQKVGIHLLQRIGVDFIWIGVESKNEMLEKNRGVDFHRLIQGLRQQGISVLISGILFLEHHDRETLEQEVDFLVDLKADFVQFMQLGPVPGTPLYKGYVKKDKLVDGVPYEEWHGQDKIWFRHPNFTREETRLLLKEAFVREYRQNSPSILRMAETMLMGAIATRDAEDEYMRLRHRHRLKNAVDFYCLMDALVTHAPTSGTKDYARDVRRRYREFFGKPPKKVTLLSPIMQVMIVKEKIRSRLVHNNMRQPKTLRTAYRA